jgi:hypothetical protein
MPGNHFTVRRLQLEGAFLADYRDVRIQLWPDCRHDSDREIAQILANPARWAAFVASVEGQTRAASRGCNEIGSDTQLDSAVSIAPHKRLDYKKGRTASLPSEATRALSTGLTARERKLALSDKCHRSGGSVAMQVMEGAAAESFPACKAFQTLWTSLSFQLTRQMGILYIGIICCRLQTSKQEDDNRARRSTGTANQCGVQVESKPQISTLWRPIGVQITCT